MDVLHYCMYADNFIALSESQFIAAKVDTLNWDPKISFEYYQNKSIGEARKALSNAESKEQFFKSVKQRLGNQTELALSLTQKLFMSDGNKSPSENAVQNDLRKYLGKS